MSHLANHTQKHDTAALVAEHDRPHLEALRESARVTATTAWATTNAIARREQPVFEPVARDLLSELGRLSKAVEQTLALLEPAIADRADRDDVDAARAHLLGAAERLRHALAGAPALQADWDDLEAGTIHVDRAGVPPVEISHTVSRWREWLSVLGLAPIRGLCGASLIDETPPPNVKPCAACARRGGWSG